MLLWPSCPSCEEWADVEFCCPLIIGRANERVYRWSQYILPPLKLRSKSPPLNFRTTGWRSVLRRKHYARALRVSLKNESKEESLLQVSLRFKEWWQRFSHQPLNLKRSRCNQRSTFQPNSFLLLICVYVASLYAKTKRIRSLSCRENCFLRLKPGCHSQSLRNNCKKRLKITQWCERESTRS